jgi:hypothetical protein
MEPLKSARSRSTSYLAICVTSPLDPERFGIAIAFHFRRTSRTLPAGFLSPGPDKFQQIFFEKPPMPAQLDGF